MDRRAVFFDRDGVINKSVIYDGKPFPPQSLHEFEWVDGVETTLDSLNKAGYLCLVVTNQPDVARGKQTRNQVEEIHNHILATLPVERIYTCYHDDEDHCLCRKPGHGLLLQAQQDFNINLKQSYLVGDRWRDIDAGHAAGCTTIYLNYFYNENLRHQPHFQIERLIECLAVIPLNTL